jgi:uncharacterized protein (TIGR03083 family)
MDKDAVWAAIDSQRLRTADLLEGLSEEQWRHPSLCDGWTVRDVAAHLSPRRSRPAPQQVKVKELYGARRADVRQRDASPGSGRATQQWQGSGGIVFAEGDRTAGRSELGLNAWGLADRGNAS